MTPLPGIPLREAPALRERLAVFATTPGGVATTVFVRSIDALQEAIRSGEYVKWSAIQMPASLWVSPTLEESVEQWYGIGGSRG